MFSKKRRTCWTAAPDLERREPVLPQPVADPEDLLMSEQQTPSAEARAGVLNPTPWRWSIGISCLGENPTAHAALKRQEPPCASENSANGLASRSPYVSRTEVSFPEDLDLIGRELLPFWRKRNPSCPPPGPRPTAPSRLGPCCKILPLNCCCRRPPLGRTAGPITWQTQVSRAAWLVLSLRTSQTADRSAFRGNVVSQRHRRQSSRGPAYRGF